MIFLVCAGAPKICTRAGDIGCAADEGDASILLQDRARVSTEDATEVEESPKWKGLSSNCRDCIRKDWSAISKDAKPVFVECVKGCSPKSFLPSVSSYHSCKMKCRKQARSSLPSLLHCAACLTAASPTLMLLDVPEDEFLDDDEASGASFLDSLAEGNEYDDEELEGETVSDDDYNESDSAIMRESAKEDGEYDSDNIDSSVGE